MTIEANQPGSITAGNTIVEFPNNQIRQFNDVPVMGTTQLAFTGTKLNEGSSDTLSPGDSYLRFL